MAVTRDSSNFVKIYVGDMLRTSFRMVGTINPYTTNFDRTYNCGLWIGNSGQHSAYRWDGYIAECTLTTAYIDITPLLPVTDTFTANYRNNLVVDGSATNVSSFDANTTAAKAYQTATTSMWVSQVLTPGAEVWQRRETQSCGNRDARTHHEHSDGRKRDDIGQRCARRVIRAGTGENLRLGV